MKRASLHTRLASVAVLALTTLFAFANNSNAQIVQRAVGGVAIDADGLLSSLTLEDSEQLESLRKTALDRVPEELAAFNKMRGVSLKQINSAVAKSVADSSPLPEEIRYLAGLQRIEYVFVYPQRNDIVLAGPAEGWQLDALGNVVGKTTKRPVILLDDLVVALRTAASSRLEPISCSIDPSQEGMQRLQGVLRQLQRERNPQVAMTRLEDALGPQEISLTGIPASSHFARVMVAADFRMKRLAMNFDEAPVAKMPSFMELASSRNSSMTPRWWLAPKYDSLARDAEGLAWQLRGQGVQCKTEEDQFNADGKRESSRAASPAAQKWAEMMTGNYPKLAEHDSVFGQLRNVMDLAVVAALIEKEELLATAGLEISNLMQDVELAEYPVPRFVDTQASFVRNRGSYTVSASGGVQMLPWHVADKTEEVASVSEVRNTFSADSGNWWLQ